jgi:6-pyruvoyltetrahydropterin/6-carboxytetrahydropterin synthase
MHTVTKSYRDLPAAHRQPKHDGHCRLIHGHNWGFDIVFVCEQLDENGFVIDVGKLKPVKAWLEYNFDHTLLLNVDDPSLHLLTTQLGQEFARVVPVLNCGMEGLAKFVFESLESLLETQFPDDVCDRALSVIEVVCWEDSKNRASYIA